MFQLTQFNPTAAAEAAKALAGAFNDVAIREYNQIRNDGDGNLEVVVGGQVLKKARQHMIVLAGFSGSTFQETRRQFWMGKWNKTQEGTPPDCFSENGEVPHAEAQHKQHTDCRTCPRTVNKNAEGYTDCSYTKDMLVYLMNVDASGQAVLALDTPLIWRASAMSVFGKVDQASNSAGLIAMAQMLLKHGVRVFEQVAFEMAFHQTSKAPTLKIMGMLPEAEAARVIQVASQPDTKALLEFKPPKPAAGALPRPTQTAPVGQVGQQALPALGTTVQMPAVTAAAPVVQVVAATPAAAPAAAPSPAAAAFGGFGPASIVPAATQADVAQAAAPIVNVAPPPAAPAVTAASVQAEVMQLMAAGQPVPPEKMALLMQLMQGAAAPAPAASAPPPAAVASAPVAQAAPASAQAAALAAFSLATPTR